MVDWCELQHRAVLMNYEDGGYDGVLDPVSYADSGQYLVG